MLLSRWSELQVLADSLQETIRQQLSVLSDKKQDLNAIRIKRSNLKNSPESLQQADGYMLKFLLGSELVGSSGYCTATTIDQSPMLQERIEALGTLLFRVSSLHSWVCDAVCGAIQVGNEASPDHSHQRLESIAREAKNKLVLKTSQFEARVDSRAEFFLANLQARLPDAADAGVLFRLFAWLGEGLALKVLCSESRLSKIFFDSIDCYLGVHTIDEFARLVASRVFDFFAGELNNRLCGFRETLKAIESENMRNALRYFPVSGRTLAKLYPRKHYSLWELKVGSKNLVKYASYSASFIHSPRRKGAQPLSSILVKRRTSDSGAKPSPLKSSRLGASSPPAREEASRECPDLEAPRHRERAAETRLPQEASQTKARSPYRTLARIVRYQSSGVTQKPPRPKPLDSAAASGQACSHLEIQQLISQYQRQARVRADSGQFSLSLIARSLTTLKSTKNTARIKSSVPSVSNTSAEILRASRGTSGVQTDPTRQRAIVLVKKPTAKRKDGSGLFAAPR